MTGGEIGPNLTGVVGRRSGSVPGFAYSAAMRDPKTAVAWDELGLVTFITNPQGVYPGTKMALPPRTDHEPVLQIVTWLKNRK